VIKSFNRHQEIELDDLHKLWEVYYKALYSFGTFIDNMKILLDIKVL
jgi:hypothetical protein